MFNSKLFLATLGALLCGVVIGGVLVAYLSGSLVTSPAQSNTSISQASNEPNIPREGTRLKFGLFTTDPNPEADNTKLGHKMNIMGWFTHWSGELNNNKLQSACNGGYVPEVTWESWGGVHGTSNYSLADIADGKYDKLITDQLQQVKDVCQNRVVLIRFDQEMDLPPGSTSWYPWQGDTGQYVAAWRHVVKIGHHVDPSIKWIWSPNRGNATVTPQYYPGNQWVDYVGITLNHEHLPLEIKYQTFAQFYQANQQVIESFNKPIIISETTSDEGFGNKDDWVTGMFDYALHNPKITALVWFTVSPTYNFDSSPTTLKAFQQSLNLVNAQPNAPKIKRYVVRPPVAQPKLVIGKLAIKPIR